MKVKYFFLIIVTTFFYAIPSYAVDITDTYSWNSDGESGVYYRENNKDSLQKFFAQVSHSKNGEQRLYFYKLDLDVFVMPEDVEKRRRTNILMKDIELRGNNNTPGTTIMVFNGQAIKMSVFTEIYYKTQKEYYYYTPQTVQGHNHVVNLFKKATAPVKIEFDDKVLHIPSKGFTRTWNSNGGNAI